MVVLFLGSIAVPDPFDGVRKELGFGVADAVAGVLAEEVLVGIAFGLEDFGHAVIGFDPVVHAVTHDVGVVVVAVSNGEKDAERFWGDVGDEGVVEVPGSAGGFGIKGPLLVHEGAGSGEDAVVEVGTIPGHDESGGTSGAAAHDGTPIRVFGELYFAVLLYSGQDFGFDVFCVEAGHGVVFLSTLMSLSVATSVGHKDGNHRGNTLLGDQVVQDAGNIHSGFTLGAIMNHHKRSFRAGFVLGWDVDGDLANVVDLVSIHDEGLGIVGIHCAKYLSGNPGVEQLGVLGIDFELLDFPLWHAGFDFAFAGWSVFRPDEVIAFRINGRIDSGLVIQPNEFGSSRCIKLPGWRRLTFCTEERCNNHCGK